MRDDVRRGRMLIRELVEACAVWRDAGGWIASAPSGIHANAFARVQHSGRSGSSGGDAIWDPASIIEVQ